MNYKLTPVYSMIFILKTCKNTIISESDMRYSSLQVFVLGPIDTKVCNPKEIKLKIVIEKQHSKGLYKTVT